MAIVTNQPSFEEEEEKKKNSPTIGGQPATTGTGAPSGGGAGIQQKNQTGPSSSGSFTDLGAYLEANRGSIPKMTESVVGGIQGQLADAQNNAGQQADNYRQQIQSQALSAKPFEGKTASQINDIEGARKVLAGSYEGPQASDVDLGLSGIQDASKQAELGQTFSGKQSLLDQQMRQNIGDYSKGERDLDAVFLSQNPTSKSAFQNLASETRAAEQEAAGQQQALRDLVSDVQSKNLAAKENLEAGLRNQFDNLSGNVSRNSINRRKQLSDSVSGQLVNYLEDLGVGNNEGVFKNSDVLSDRQKEIANEFLGQNVMTSAETQRRSNPFGMPVDYGQFQAKNNLATKLLNDYSNQTGRDLFSGLSGQQAAEAQAIKELTSGISGLGNLTSGAQELSQRGIYDENVAANTLLNYFKNL